MTRNQFHWITDYAGRTRGADCFGTDGLAMTKGLLLDSVSRIRSRFFSGWRCNRSYGTGFNGMGRAYEIAIPITSGLAPRNDRSGRVFPIHPDSYGMPYQSRQKPDPTTHLQLSGQFSQGGGIGFKSRRAVEDKIDFLDRGWFFLQK